MPAPTPAQLKAAFESLSRLRTVELPPDSTGGRTLFHRGAGAGLASRVDKDGKVTRHELFFFGAYLSWAPAKPIAGGATPESTLEAVISRGDGPATGVDFDVEPAITLQRIATAAHALADVVTDDPVLQHLKQVIATGAGGGELAVTRTQHAVDLEMLRREAEESQRREVKRRKRAQNVVLVVFAVVLLVAFGSIAAWIIAL